MIVLVRLWVDVQRKGELAVAFETRTLFIAVEYFV